MIFGKTTIVGPILKGSLQILVFIHKIIGNYYVSDYLIQILKIAKSYK